MVQVEGTCGCIFEISRNFFQSSHTGDSVGHTDTIKILNLCKEHDTALDTQGLDDVVEERTVFEQKITDSINSKVDVIDVKPDPEPSPVEPPVVVEDEPSG